MCEGLRRQVFFSALRFGLLTCALERCFRTAQGWLARTVLAHKIKVPVGLSVRSAMHEPERVSANEGGGAGATLRPLKIKTLTSLSEKGCANTHHRGAKADSGFKVVAHTHTELRKIVRARVLI